MYAPEAVFLHGGGEASKERFIDLMRELARLGHTSWAFDFYGQGDSPGRLHEQSLATRESQARRVIDLCGSSRVVLVGFSMSGQTVCDLVASPPSVEIGGVLLGAPAAFAAEARDASFGGEFGAIIRMPGSWRRTTAFHNLASFAGARALVTPEFDDVIPREVSDGYRHAVGVGGSRIELPGAPHQLGLWLGQHRRHRARVAKVLSDLIGDGSGATE